MNFSASDIGNIVQIAVTNREDGSLIVVDCGVLEACSRALTTLTYTLHGLSTRTVDLHEHDCYIVRPTATSTAPYTPYTEVGD